MATTFTSITVIDVLQKALFVAIKTSFNYPIIRASSLKIALFKVMNYS